MTARPAAPAGTPRSDQAADRVVIGRSLFWSALESGSMAVVSALLLVAFARFLSPEQFGVFAIVIAIVEVLAVVAGMLFHDALIQHPSPSARHVDTAFTTSVAIGMLLVIAAWAAGPWLVTSTGAADAGDLLLFTALSLPFSAGATVLIAQERRAMNFRPLALRSVASRLLGGAVGLVALVLGFGTWALGAQWLTMALANALLLALIVPRIPRPLLAAPESRELLRFGVPALGSGLLVYTSRRLFIFGIGVALGPEFAGYLSLAFRLVDMLWSLCATAIGQIALPVLSRMQDDADRLAATWISGLRLSALLVYPMFAGLAAAAPEVVLALFGDRWRESAALLAVLAAAVLFQLPQFLSLSLLKARGFAGSSLVMPASELVVVGAIVTGMLLVGPQGAAAPLIAALCWLAREGLLAVITAGILRSRFGFKPATLARALASPLALAALVAAAIAVARTLLPEALEPAWRLAILVAVGAALVAPALASTIAPLAREMLSRRQRAFG